MKTSSILDCKKSGRPSIDEETVDAVHVAFHHSPRKSICVASNELAIPQSIVYKVLQKDFGSMLISYKLFKLLSQMITLAKQLLLNTQSFAIQDAAGFHKIFKPSLNAVSVRRVLPKLISKFMLYCSW